MCLTLGGDEQIYDLADRPRVEVIETGLYGFGGERVEPLCNRGFGVDPDHVVLVNRSQPQRAVQGVAGGGDCVELAA